MEEPSVLDYVKSKIFFWRQESIHIPEIGASPDVNGQQPQLVARGSLEPGLVESGGEVVSSTPDRNSTRFRFSWVLVRALVPLGFAIMAQLALEPPGRSVGLSVFLYLISLAILVWSSLKGEWSLPENPSSVLDQPLAASTYRPVGLWACIALCFLAFLMFGNNTFTKANLLVWILALVALLAAFWQSDPHKPVFWSRLGVAWENFKTRGITLSPWTLLVLAVFSLAGFYRFYLLEQIPFEMFSDHAEKLLDVGDVINGRVSIFYPRNTGREVFQMVLTAAVALIFKTGLSFISLKLGTALCGLFTLPFIYLLGVEVANRRVGLLAMFFAGIAYWPNVISRVALRFTLYPTFTAPMLYFLVRGLQRRRRNDFILAGIFLGLGLHGYSPYRFVPVLVVVAVGLYLFHRRSIADNLDALWNLWILSLTSFIVFLPLFRYAVSNPMSFTARMMTRMGQVERAFPEPPLQIFFTNLWRSLIMPFWDNGEIWVHSIPHRPALGTVSAVFFGLGVVLLVIRYVRKRHWLDLFWLVSIPLLMMPSILSLAFPEENPSLNRAGGALVVIFLIVGMAFDSFLSLLKSKKLSPGGTWLAWIVGVVLFFVAASQNYDLVFNQYADQFRTYAWNTSELGAIIRQFADSSGEEDSAWVVPYPHWVDTRLVGIRAGFPQRDFALWREDISETVTDPRPKLFLVKPEDIDTLELLEYLYPTSVQRLFDSKVEGRDFYMVSVPPTE